jgi:hypothetical protein
MQKTLSDIQNLSMIENVYTHIFNQIPWPKTQYILASFNLLFIYLSIIYIHVITKELSLAKASTEPL